MSAPARPARRAGGGARPDRARGPRLVLLAGAAILAVTGLAGCSTDGTVRGAIGDNPTSEYAIYGQPAPSGANQLLGVACPTAERCFAVGSGPPVLNPAPGPARAVIVTTADGGTSWKALRAVLSGPSSLSAVSCATVTTCMAVGDTDAPGLAPAVAVTTDGGRVWNQVSAPANAVDVVGVQCVPGSCMVLATDGGSYWTATTNDGGMVWQTGGTLPAGFGGAGQLVCPTTSACLVAGYVPTGAGNAAGAIATTLNGGATWQAASVPANTGLLHDVSCPSATLCLAVGTQATAISDITLGHGDLLESTDGGATFHQIPAPEGINDGFGLSCPTVRSCVAVGTVWTPTVPSTPLPAVVTTTNFARSWKNPEQAFIPASLVDVTCPSATQCVAVGSDIVAHLALPAVAVPATTTTAAPGATGTTGTTGPHTHPGR